MNFTLNYEGAPGFIAATLLADGVVADSTTGLGSGKAAQKWGRKAAAAHKLANSADEFTREDTTVHVSGRAGFSL